MNHMAEGGINGSILYITFLLSIIKVFWSLKLYKDYLYYPLLISFSCVITIGITARVYQYQFFFPIFGLIIGYYYRKRRDIVKKMIVKSHNKMDVTKLERN